MSSSRADNYLIAPPLESVTYPAKLIIPGIAAGTIDDAAVPIHNAISLLHSLNVTTPLRICPALVS